MLIELPFPRIHYIFPVKRWAGVQVQDMDSFFRRAYGAVSKYEGAEEAALKGVSPVSVLRHKTREFNDAV